MFISLSVKGNVNKKVFKSELVAKNTTFKPVVIIFANIIRSKNRREIEHF